MIILFDLNGTLPNPAAIGEPWQVPDLGAGVLAAAVHTAAVDALTDRFRPFAEHIRGALEAAIRRRRLDLEKLDQAMERAAALPPYADADAALTTLASAGHRLAVLTNSGADSGRRTLAAAGLDAHFEAILGVDPVRSYKPHPSTYRYALEALGAAASDVMLVAAHQWDVTGAKRAGLRTAWIDRDSEPFSAVGEPPDAQAPSLADLARHLGGPPG